jgi:hypothetical protein
VNKGEPEEGQHHPPRKWADFRLVFRYERVWQIDKKEKQMMATIASASLYKSVNWNAIDWHKASQIVSQLQARIVKATRSVFFS